MSSERHAELVVRFREAGFHCWPEAPDHRAYLRDPHRHVFHVEVRTATAADDSREVEYHDLIDNARTLWQGMGGPDFGARSCETLAGQLADRVAALLRRPVAVEVTEDGEAGARALSVVAAERAGVGAAKLPPPVGRAGSGVFRP